MSINFYIVLFIIHNSEDFQRSLLWILYFEEWVRMLESSLAFLTKIKIRAYRAFITSSNYISLLTVITSNSFVNNNLIFDFLNSRLFHFKLFKVFGNNFFLYRVLSYERLVGNSRSLREFFRNLGLNFRNYIWKHLLQSFLN